jgi:hypothetical protein
VGKARSKRLDLTVYSEETRQALYDRAVEENFTRQKVHGVEWDPLYTPEQAGLEVVFLYGRWMITWWKLEEPENVPERERRELLLVERPPRSRKIVYREI